MFDIAIADAQSNITKIEYYIDNDPGYGLATNVAFTLGINIANLNIPINPSSISTGVHTLSIRARDANGGWSLQNSKILYKPYTANSAPALSNVTKLEYFIDNDPGYGLATNVTVIANTNIANLVLAINPSSLTNGVHLLSIRAKDANGNWSLQNSTILYKPYTLATPGAQPNITKLEYFIDNDPGYGLATNVTVTAGTNIANVVIPINPATLSLGVHMLSTRTKDANGNWSLQNSTILYKPYTLTTPGAQPNITKLEYFIDIDPGYGQATNVVIPASTNIANTIIPINPTSLTTGVHTFVIRSKDANGNWSLLNAVILYKPYTLPTTGSQPNITKVEYYFDYDPGYGNATNVPITSGTNISNLVIPIDPFPLTVCEHAFHIRAKDANGNWSLLNYKPVTIPMTIYMKLFLQGYYTGNGFMTSTLTNEGVQSGPCADVDSVTVELHNPAAPYALAFSYKGVIRSDGILPCKFPSGVNGNSYYIAIRHRNAVQTWSAAPVLMSQTANYDFTTAANKAYGSNQVEVDSNVWAFYSGDLNQDENVDLLDLSILETDVNNFLFGYFKTDINGDGNVDLLDSPIVENNINGFIFSNHP